MRAAGRSVVRFGQTRDVTTANLAVGLRLTVRCVTRATPFTINAAEGPPSPLPRDQNAGTSGYRFASWSDAGARSHAYTVPASRRHHYRDVYGRHLCCQPSMSTTTTALTPGTDGLLILRYLLGYRGAALVLLASLLRRGRARRQPAAIEVTSLPVLPDLDIGATTCAWRRPMGC